ncbi:MAG: lytic murein transglycosylase [Patescibacteria group bacterium]
MRIFLLIILFLSSFFSAPQFFLSAEVDSATIAQRREQLEQELRQLESQIDQYRSIIQEKQKQSTTLERDIDILNAKIEKARLSIKARNIMIAELNSGIKEKTEVIGSLMDKIDREKASLAAVVRKANELDSMSLIEIVLGYDKLSDFFVDFDTFESIHRDIQDSMDKIRDSKISTEKEKDDLENKKSEETQLKAMQELEKIRLEEAGVEKKNILKLTKGEEKKYQDIVNSKQKDAAKIRTALFMLRGTAAIPFEKAVEYANLASKATGVRAAFLLGVIAEESNLGENVGTGNWKVDLSNSKCKNQRTAFIQITNELGLDPDAMPVSKKAWYGYCGGAMGPAQFMPTTWQLYKDSIASITGHYPPNPWDPKDAFVAAALLLKDNGAANGGYASERKAALKYLAGSNWSKPAYSFYGDDVMDLAAKYQGQMDILASL